MIDLCLEGNWYTPSGITVQMVVIFANCNFAWPQNSGYREYAQAIHA